MKYIGGQRKETCKVGIGRNRVDFILHCFNQAGCPVSFPIGLSIVLLKNKFLKNLNQCSINLYLLT